MTILNEKEVAAFAFKEAISREKYTTAKLQFYLEIIKNSDSKHIFNSLLAVSQSRLELLQKEMKNLNIS